MRILQIGADRSKTGTLVRGSAAHQRQRAYADVFGNLDIIGYSLRWDGFSPIDEGSLRTFPTNAPLKLLYGTYALLIARRLPRPAVISTQDPHGCGLLGLWLARAWKVPLHVQVHTDIFSFSYGLHSPLNFIRLHIALYVLKRADGIRVVSDRIRESIEKRLTPKRAITVLPIYTDLTKFATALPLEDDRFFRFKEKLLVVARLESEKNVALALTAFKASAPANACLIILGTGSLRPSLEALTHSLGIPERVFFEGHKDPAPYYKLADLVLVPSTYEVYGNVIIEALAAGTPVLSTDVGIAREAGAIVARANEFEQTFSHWFAEGPRTAELKGYPYASFEEYVRAYCADITACTERAKKQ
jgi:glycosyltransferase involved in cell wall biosynthesis